MKSIAKTGFGVLVLLAGVRLLAAQRVGPQGQAGSMVGSSRSQSDLIQRTYAVQGKVKTLQGDLVRGAKVVVRVANFMGSIQTLQSDEQGEFRTECKLTLETAQGFAVDVTVTKRGYMPAHAIVDFGNSGSTWVIPVTLRDLSMDSNLLSQEDLIANLAPRLKQLSASDGLADKEAKDYARGVDEFLRQNDADRALSEFAKVLRRDDSCAACRTMWGLAQLASNDWDGAERNFLQAIKEIRDDPKKARPEPYDAYGVMESWRHDPKTAAGSYLNALKIAPQDPFALEELGRSQLALQNWAGADADLQRAIAAGADSEARFMRVQALLRTDNFREANHEMTVYLAGRDAKKMPPHVRQVWSEVQTRLKAQETVQAKANVDGTIDDLLGNIPELKGLQPAADQTALESILTAVGKNVATEFQNFPNTISTEQIHQEKLQRSGKVGDAQDQHFQYLCLSSPEAWGPGFSEYRADSSGSPGAQKGLQEGFMLTTGFTSAALMFHPLYQPDAKFRYLGTQKLNDRNYFVISYAQQPGKAHLTGAFRLNGAPSPTFSQGVAWVDSESYQIVRIRQDLLTPLPEVRLERQTTEIDFGAVRFKKISQEFWLPQRVIVAVDWNGRHLRNEHQYSDFKLFNVDAKEDENGRKDAKPASKEQTGPRSPL